MKLHEFKEMVQAQKETQRLANLEKMSVLSATITTTKKKEETNVR
jgi:hypothetical protein